MSDDIVSVPLPKSKRFQNLTGRVFVRLTVISYAGLVLFGKTKRAAWNCRCECGELVVVSSRMMICGDKQSCGCLGLGYKVTHGLSRSPEYQAWKSIVQRCTNEKNSGYEDYGGRGIKVCERWLESFENFYLDVGPRPSESHSIDRFPNNNGNYEPGNVRWASSIQQARNKRTTAMLTLNGITKSASDWSEETGISYAAIKARKLKLGWSDERTLTTPCRFKSR